MVKIEENNDTKNLKIRSPLKYLKDFWRTLEMPLSICKIHLILTWSNRCFIIDNPIVDQVRTFTITDTKLMFYLELYQLKIMQNCLNN